MDTQDVGAQGDLLPDLQPFFARWRGRRLTLALSGGVDSVVLLHLLWRARQAGWADDVQAVHVHHGLNRDADAWLHFCQTRCAEYGIALHSERVQVQAQGLGVEAAARAARYAVFRRVATDALLLAHHRDDQAETFLLAALRGGGLRALAAMPEQRELEGSAGVMLCRPLLAVSRVEIEAYAAAQGLAWVNDSSNADTVFLRNHVRQEWLPQLAGRVPNAQGQLLASVAQLQESLALADEWTQEDWARVHVSGCFDVARWRKLGAARQRNLLAELLRRHGLGTARRSSIAGFAQTLLQGAEHAEWHLPKGRVYADRGRLFALGDGWQNTLAWKQPQAACAPEWQAVEHGLPLHLAERGSIAAAGSARRIALNGGHKSVKQLLQEAGVPAFMRPHWPVWLSEQGECLAVCNLRCADAVRVAGGVLPVLPELAPFLYRSGVEHAVLE